MWPLFVFWPWPSSQPWDIIRHAQDLNFRFFQTITLSLINMSVPVEGGRSYKNCNIRLYLLFCVPVKTTTTNSSHCQRPTTFLSFKQTICPSVTFSSLKTSFSIWLPHLHQRQTSHNSRSKE